MAEQMRPASPDQAPDPSNNYERAHPENEAGLGSLKNNVATPQTHPDAMEQAVKQRQDGTRQINAHDPVDQRREGNLSASSAGPAPAHGRPSGPLMDQPDHSMKDETPLGWDQAPTDIHDPRHQRHPKTEGKGGTP